MSTKLSLFCKKVIEAGWLGAVIAVPLFFNIHSTRTFEPDKLTLLRSIVIVMIVAWLISLMEDGLRAADERSFGDRFKAWVKQPLVLPTLLMVIVYIVSTIFSISPKVSLWGSYQRMQGTYTMLSYIVMFALIAVNMTSRDQAERLISAMILASIPVSLYGIIQRNGLDPLPWQGDVTHRVASNLGNAIFVASYLIMVVPLTISRLVKSMQAIVTDEHASWGHTVLAALYIFILAIQLLTVLYSGSRGPQIGLLGAFALMGLLLLLILRQQADDRQGLSIREIGLGVLVLFPLGLVTLGAGGLGYLGGLGIDALLAGLNLQAEGLPLLGAALGALIGFAGSYVYAATSGRGWRWLWVSWPVLGIAALVFVILLNNPEGPLAPLRQVPYLSRLGQITNIESGTGKVRILIWEGAIKLIKPHRPLGIEGEFTDSFNAIRPIVGYGPESMFNAFAYAYPPELAQVEARGSSADRSHNETMDSLVITGLLGFLALYFLTGSVFFFLLRWLGWVPHRMAAWRLIGLMIVGVLTGGVTPFIIMGNLILAPVGIPFGLFGGLFVYLCWQGLSRQPATDSNFTLNQPVLLIGILGALVGHFLEVHFVFSIAATYTYFWAYLGLLVALYHMQSRPAEAEQPAEATADEPAEAEPVTPPAPRKRRRRGRRGSSRRPATGGNIGSSLGGAEVWLGSLGLVMAIILAILIFDFVPVQFNLSTGNYSMLWLTSITFLVGLAMALADTAVKRGEWHSRINWIWGTLIYLVTSLGYTGFYAIIHGQQRQTVQHLAQKANEAIQILSQQTDVGAYLVRLNEASQAALASANNVVNLFIGFYIIFFLLLLVMALMMVQGRLRRLPGWRSSNWWLYPILIVAALLVIFTKNVNVISADILLKEGQKYRDARLYDISIPIHEKTTRLDSDEDFYYLMLALNYQLKAQSTTGSPEERQIAWQQGEEVALKAREINKYNPDNTGNMGRYYFTMAQSFNQDYFKQALDYFEKTIQLAPQNVDFYNLIAQVHYINRRYEEALTWLDRSLALDDRYYPTWLTKGDTHVALQQVDEAVEAHRQAILLDGAAFGDDNFDTRLNFYLSAGRTDDLIAAFEEYAANNPDRGKAKRRSKATWAIGHIYMRAGKLDEALHYLQSAINQGYDRFNVFVEAGDIYLNQQEYQQAEQMYQLALQKNENLPQVYSSLGFIYARTGRIQEAIDANNRVLQSLPNDYDSHKNLALLYQQTGQLEQALSHAQTAVEVAPEANKAELLAFIDQLQQQLQQ